MTSKPPKTPPEDELAKRRRAATRKSPGTTKGRKETSVAGSTSGKKVITATQRQAQAVELRLAGVSLTKIAEAVGYSHASGARQAIMAALQEMLPEETRNEARRREVATLDRLQASNFAAAMSGDEKAATIVLRCVAQRSKLLGLEAPVQLDIKVREGEQVRVEFLEVLNEETLAALEPFQDEMIRLSELRAGVIDVEAEEIL